MTTNTFDVAIIGGGPAGSTLAALLQNDSRLKVGVFEQAKFPREHIGESFAHRVVLVLAQSGALPKVLDSRCWIQKFGGYYAWDPSSPAATFFDHAGYRHDGVRRWAIHVNRAEFDQILLDHARELGATVFEECRIVSAKRRNGEWTLSTNDGRQFTARFVVEASGRQRSLVARQPKKFLSSYKNVALWQHVLKGRPAQSIEADWNIFYKDNLSPIGCFAFESGWFWYIPVPKTVGGKRVETHSLGLVTDPAFLLARDAKLQTSKELLEIARSVPLLKDLIADADPINLGLYTATNYSMISERFCDFDDQWILNGDSAHFVDPLFSSGVAFALLYASSTADLLRATHEDDLNEEKKRTLWEAFDFEWHGMARSFGAAIDQWYQEISERHPKSTYWRRRAESPLDDIRDRTFQSLVDTDISPDLAQVLNRPEVIPLHDFDIPEHAILKLGPDTTVEDWMSLSIVSVKDKRSVGPRERTAFWRDPRANAHLVRRVFPEPRRSSRLRSLSSGEWVPLGGIADVDSLFARLRAPEGVAWRSLRNSLDSGEQLLMRRLVAVGLLDCRETHSPTSETTAVDRR